MRPADSPHPVDRRRYGPGDRVTEADLERALDILARLIDGPRPQVLPLYLRLEAALEDMRANKDAMSRIRERNRNKRAKRHEARP